MPKLRRPAEGRDIVRETYAVSRGGVLNLFSAARSAGARHFVLLGNLKARGAGRGMFEGFRAKEAAVDTILQERCTLEDCQQP